MRLEVTPGRWRQLIFITAMALFGALTQLLYSFAWLVWAGVITALYITYTEVIADARRRNNDK